MNSKDPEESVNELDTIFFRLNHEGCFEGVLEEGMGGGWGPGE